MKKHLLLAIMLSIGTSASAADSTHLLYRIESVAGSSTMGDGGPATAAQMGSLQGIAIDRWGSIYLSDTDRNQVRKIDLNGIISMYAGTGAAGFAGDNGPAISAELHLPYGLAVDLAGNLYIADLGNNRVRRVSPDGIITTFAGIGGQGSSGDGGPAGSAQLLSPRNLAADSAGNLYISEFGAHRVRRVTPDGRIATVAGTGIAGYRGDGGPAATAQLAFPTGLAVDRSGNLYIADSQNQRVRKVLPGGQISTVLGGTGEFSLITPHAVAVDLAGNIFVADASPVVREFTVGGAWLSAVGTGTGGFSGDGGPAKTAQIRQPLDLATDLTGNLYIADQNRIRFVDGHAVIHTVAGDNYMHAIGDGGIATAALLRGPTAVALDTAGNLSIADPGTARVRRVGMSGNIDSPAGTGLTSPGGDGTVAAATPLMNPTGVAVDVYGNLLIVETGAHRIRQISADGRIYTIVGTGSAGVGPELMLPKETQLRSPRAVCVDRSGDLYVVDTANHRVLLVPPGGMVSTAAGNGAPGFAGDGGLGRMAQLNQPSACTVDSAGNLYIADTYNHAIRKVDSRGNIVTVAGTGVAGATGDEAPAIDAGLNAPRGVAVDDNGNIYISDSGNNRIRQVTPDGVIHTIAGSGAAGFQGDDGQALNALFDGPEGILLDGSGDLYVTDTNNNRVRRLVPAGVVTPPQPEAPARVSLLNAASLTAGPIAPGEAISLFGSGLGPEAGVGAVIDSSGLLANQLGGAEVRFDGVPAPLYYVQANQINAQAPYTIATNTVTHIEVFYNGKAVGSTDAAVTAAAPGIFSVAVNQDGSFNSQINPAPRGTYLTLYATGEGLTNGANISGLPSGAPFPKPVLPVFVTVAGTAAQVAWAGSAPELVGLLQVNLRIPGGFVPSGAVPVQLMVGTSKSPELTVWLQ